MNRARIKQAFSDLEAVCDLAKLACDGDEDRAVAALLGAFVALTCQRPDADHLFQVADNSLGVARRTAAQRRAASRSEAS